MLGPSFRKKIVTAFSDFPHHETTVLPKSRAGQEIHENWKV